MDKNTFVGVIVLVAFLALGYWISLPVIPAGGTVTSQTPVVTSGENPLPGDTVHGIPPEPAAAAAQQELASKLSIDQGSITIMKVEEKTWGDGCLGLRSVGELCSQALVDGFRVELLAQGTSYFYHTNKTGSLLRKEF